MISVYCWDGGGNNRCGQWIEAKDLLARADELKKTTCSVWIDLDRPDEAEEELVFRKFLPIHSLTLEDITKLRRTPNEPHFPKAEEFPDYLFVVANPLAPNVLGALRGKEIEKLGTDRRRTTQLSAVLTENLLITHHLEPVQAVEELHKYLKKHEAQAERGPDYLFHLILDAMVDQYAPVLDHLDEALDEIEVRVFARPTQRLLMRLLQLKREIVLMRKTLIYEREVLARLSRGEFSLIDGREMVYYRNVYDHLVRYTELIEASREMVSDLTQSHLASASNRLNEIMKFLTMISTVVLPMTLIAGIYGMNFTHMPEIEWWLGYPFALSLMLTTGIGSFVYFRWRKWI
jgi:magnesium transporter